VCFRKNPSGIIIPLGCQTVHKLPTIKNRLSPTDKTI